MRSLIGIIVWKELREIRRDILRPGFPRRLQMPHAVAGEDEHRLHAGGLCHENINIMVAYHPGLIEAETEFLPGLLDEIGAGLPAFAPFFGAMAAGIDFSDANAVLLQLSDKMIIERVHLLLRIVPSSHARLVSDDEEREVLELLERKDDILIQLKILYLMDIALVLVQGAVAVKEDGFHAGAPSATLALCRSCPP